MASYFKQVPDFEYVSRIAGSKNISDYIAVKNLFKKGKIRDDIFQELAFFEKYKISGNDRPDNVAFEVYRDSNLDWVILLANNILNIQSEWPLLQDDLDRHLVNKYGDYNTLYNGIHHYETSEIKNSQGVTIVPSGLEVGSPYTVSYYDYEIKLEDAKRNIFLLKKEYLGIITNDMPEIMEYREGATQYVSSTLKRGDNIRLYS